MLERHQSSRTANTEANIASPSIRVHSALQLWPKHLTRPIRSVSEISFSSMLVSHINCPSNLFLGILKENQVLVFLPKNAQCKMGTHWEPPPKFSNFTKMLYSIPKLVKIVSTNYQRTISGHTKPYPGGAADKSPRKSCFQKGWQTRLKEIYIT